MNNDDIKKALSTCAEISCEGCPYATNMYSRVIELLNTYDVNDVIALMEKLENAEDKS